jgi:signal transduction histidine kinase
MGIGSLARVPWAAAVGVGVTAAELAVIALAGAGRLAPGTGTDDVPWLAVWFAYSLAGAVVLERVPRSAVGWLLCGIGFVPTAGIALEEAAGEGTALAAALYLLMPPLLLVGVPAAFPAGVGPSPRRRAAAAAAAAACQAGLATVVTPAGFDAVVEPVVLLGSALGGLTCLTWHLRLARRAPGPRRTQHGVFLGGFAATVVVMVLGVVVVAAVGDDELGMAWVQLAGLCCIPLGTAVAMLGTGLWGTDLAWGRRIVHVAILCVAASTAVVLVAALVSGLALSPFWVAVGAVAAAVLLVPALWWLWKAVGHLLYGPGRMAPRRLDDPDGVEDADLAGLVSAALRASAAEVVTQDPAGAPAGSLVLPLGAGRHLVVHPRRAGESFTRRDRTVAERMAAELAVHLERRELRRRLDAAQSALAEQRRRDQQRLRAALHDTVGPLLVGAEMHARALRDAATAPGIDAVYDSLRQAREAMRSVLDEGSPRALAAGLETALAELCAKWPEPPVAFESTLDRPVGSPVATAAYHVVAEALANVAQHAGADSCTVRMYTAGRELVVEIDDDGNGIDSTQTTGIGLASMRGRALELGGELALEPLPRGTRVTARFPLGAG